MVSMWYILKKSNNWNCSPMEKTEIIIRCIGIYFLVLGFICALQIPMFFEISDKGSIACQICVILMCVPRLFYKNKKWASVLLLICCILTSFALLHFDALAIFLTLTFKQITCATAFTSYFSRQSHQYETVNKKNRFNHLDCRLDDNRVLVVPWHCSRREISSRVFRGSRSYRSVLP